MFDVQFNNIADFRFFLKNLSLDNRQGKGEKDKTLIYNDPPYQGNTNDNYSKSFVYEDLIDLIEANIATGCKFCISEFGSDVVYDLAKATII